MDKFHKELMAKYNHLVSERDSISVELQALRKRKSDINSIINGLEHLFELDGISDSEVYHKDKESQSKKLADILKEIMKDGASHAVDDLINTVKSIGYDFEEKNPYRSINFTLMGLSRGDEFIRDGEGWRYVG